MVGGLVEQQQVGARQQQTAQGHTASLTAGQGRDVGVTRGDAQRVHGDLQRPVEVPRPARFDRVGYLGELVVDLGHGVVVERLGHLLRQRVEAVEQPSGLRHAVADVAQDVLGVVELWLLPQVADGDAGAGPRLALELGVDAGHDPQQGRLAGAVGTDHPDLGSGEERQPDPRKDLLVGGHDLGQALHHVLILSHAWRPRGHGNGSGGFGQA